MSLLITGQCSVTAQGHFTSNDDKKMFVTLEASERYADSIIYIKIESISVLKQRLNYLTRTLDLSMENDSLFLESVDILEVTREQVEKERDDLSAQVNILTADVESLNKHKDKMKRRRNFWRVLALSETAAITAFVLFITR